uniref:Secreted protein n=1 Tax=Plectus sambesii TaxID=2011161 RepID=A0A914VMK4_9BILA
MDLVALLVRALLCTIALLADKLIVAAVSTVDKLRAQPLVSRPFFHSSRCSVCVCTLSRCRIAFLRRHFCDDIAETQRRKWKEFRAAFVWQRTFATAKMGPSGIPEVMKCGRRERGPVYRDAIGSISRRRWAIGGRIRDVPPPPEVAPHTDHC